MTYDYHCEACNKPYDVIKFMSEYDGKDKCPDCGAQGRRVYSSNIEFIGTKVQDAYKCTGLGEVIKSKRQRDELIKKKDLIEVGSEKPEKIHQHFEAERQARRDKSWKDV